MTLVEKIIPRWTKSKTTFRVGGESFTVYYDGEEETLVYVREDSKHVRRALPFGGPSLIKLFPAPPAGKYMDFLVLWNDGEDLVLPRGYVGELWSRAPFGVRVFAEDFDAFDSWSTRQSEVAVEENDGQREEITEDERENDGHVMDSVVMSGSGMSVEVDYFNTHLIKRCFYDSFFGGGLVTGCVKTRFSKKKRRYDSLKTGMAGVNFVIKNASNNNVLVKMIPLFVRSVPMFYSSMSGDVYYPWFKVVVYNKYAVISTNFTSPVPDLESTHRMRIPLYEVKLRVKRENNRIVL